MSIAAQNNAPTYTTISNVKHIFVILGAFDIGDTGKTDIEADGTMPFNKGRILFV